MRSCSLDTYPLNLLYIVSTDQSQYIRLLYLLHDIFVYLLHNMDASSTTAALENFLDDFNEENPPFLSCKDCLCTDYTPDPSTQEVTVQIKLCSVHSANLQAPNPSTSPAPPVLNSPDPTRPIAVPTANRTLPAGRRRDDDNQQIVPAVLVVDMQPLLLPDQLPLLDHPALLDPPSTLPEAPPPPDRDHL